jgi:hypothetical protein
MVEFFLMMIALASALSLLSYSYCWHDIKTGHPHIISLRQMTNVMDRNRLNNLFGRHDNRYRYHLSPPMLKSFIKNRQWFYHSEMTADAVCLAGAYLYLNADVSAASVGWFILLAGACQVINFAYSIWLVRKWAHQIREELGE